MQDEEGLIQARNTELVTKEVSWRYIQKMLKRNKENIRESQDGLQVSYLGNWGMAMPFSKKRNKGGKGGFRRR